jgi:serine/threonine protein kinase
LFIVIEYVEGGSLADMRKRYGPWPERLVAIYTAQLLEGLDFLHKQVTSVKFPNDPW